MFYIATWPILLLVIHFIVNQVFEIDHFGEILIRIEFSQTGFGYEGFAAFIAVCSRDKQNIFPEFRLNCTIAEIHQSQSYYK